MNVCSESRCIVHVKGQTSFMGQQKVITRDKFDVEMCALVLLPLFTRLLTASHPQRLCHLFPNYQPYRATFGTSNLWQELIDPAQTTLL